MKRTIQAAIIGLLILAAGTASAADTAAVAVSANVVGTCRFTPGGASLSFGDLPFDAGGNAVGTALSSSLTFWCTNGASYTITDDSGIHELVAGSRRMQSTTLGTPEFIDYGLTYVASGTGNGPPPIGIITLTLNGTVGATYTANTPDTYTDTVTLTINP